MESKWRFNVHDFGMWGTSWRLAARLLAFPNTLVVANRAHPAPRYALFDVSDPDQLPVFVANLLVLQTAPTFPYGNEVEPD